MNKKTKIDVSLIVPCYNEEKNVSLFIKKVKKTFDNKIENYEIIFINDGSSDDTLKNLKNNIEKNMQIIDFSKNFGKEAAMLAGLENASGKYIGIIDADLQQDPKYIVDMKKILDKNNEYDEVAAYQKERKENFIVKKLKTKFYSIMMKQTGLDVGKTTSDFRLFRSNVKDAILKLSEKSRFSKGLFAYVGFNIYYIPYEVQKREYGTSKWSLSKLFNYAVGGIADFSVKPLLLQFKIGILSLIISLILLITFLILHLSSIWIVLSIILIFISIQNILFGINNFYIGKIFVEEKNRPVYIVKNIYKGKKEK